MSEEYIEEEIKTMFKVSKRLQGAFSDVKSLTYRYLLKVKSLKTKRAIQLGEIEEKERKQETDKKKRERLEQLKKKRESEKKQSKQKGGKGPTPNRQSKNKANIQQMARQSSHRNDNRMTRPQQPLSPYFLFLNDKKKQIKASSPNMGLEHISRIMRSIWDKLSDDEKRPYALEYEKLRIQYDKQMQIYYKNMSSSKDKNNDNRNKSMSKDKNKGGNVSQKSKDAFDYIDELDL